MRWPWHRRSEREAAEKALRDAEERLARARERWPEVREEVERLRAARRRNHFAALFPDIGGGKR